MRLSARRVRDDALRLVALDVFVPDFVLLALYTESNHLVAQNVSFYAGRPRTFDFILQLFEARRLFVDVAEFGQQLLRNKLRVRVKVRDVEIAREELRPDPKE